MGFHSKGK